MPKEFMDIVAPAIFWGFVAVNSILVGFVLIAAVILALTGKLS